MLDTSFKYSFLVNVGRDFFVLEIK